MNLKIRAIAPLDFDLSARIFSDGDPQIRRYEDGKYWQILRVKDKLILVTIESAGTIDKPKLSIEPRSKGAISAEDSVAVEENVRSLFNLGFDLRPFYEHAKNDPIMMSITQKLYGLRSPTTASVFEALVDSIVEQQISLNVAHSLEVKLIKTFGDMLQVNNEVYYAYPTPQKLAYATIEQLRKCGLSQRKAEYIKNVSEMILAGKLNLEKLKDREDTNAIIRALDGIKGIGVWTAELTMVRGMRKLDALPADDLGLRRVISHYYCGDRRISSEEARRIAEKWGKWKGLASFYLIVAEMLGITS